MTTHGFLDHCTQTPGTLNKISGTHNKNPGTLNKNPGTLNKNPGTHNKKANVKDKSGRLKPGPSHIQDYFNEWILQPVRPDGSVKIWVYGVTTTGFVLIVFIIVLSFLLCKNPKPTNSPHPPQKQLTLAYDGDMDM
ncbi:hypothetical protein UPYG_G00160770 [Umbra pygmaea]|uniref:Uncharacterized protein n=1 Tax=Umbra pygmaea TaxID=75934 RepID=A0ABD0X398_UMBPY